jgi:hypothetical protein
VKTSAGRPEVPELERSFELHVRGVWPAASVAVGHTPVGPIWRIRTWSNDFLTNLVKRFPAEFATYNWNKNCTLPHFYQDTLWDTLCKKLHDAGSTHQAKSNCLAPDTLVEILSLSYSVGNLVEIIESNETALVEISYSISIYWSSDCRRNKIVIHTHDNSRAKNTQ